MSDISESRITKSFAGIMEMQEKMNLKDQKENEKKEESLQMFRQIILGNQHEKPFNKKFLWKLTKLEIKIKKCEMLSEGHPEWI